jgi:putative endonuclease
LRHWAEDAAREYLLARGYTVLAENFYVRGGEIDLVMDQDGETVFVEVRQRSRSDFGTPAETLDRRKLARLRRAAEAYLQQRFGRNDLPARFDAVLISGTRERHRIEHLTAIS